MKEYDTDDIQCKTNTAHDHNEHWILYSWTMLGRLSKYGESRTLQWDESLNRLQEDAHTERQQESAVEESTQKWSSLPAKRKCIWRVLSFWDLRGNPLVGESGGESPPQVPWMQQKLQ